MCARSPASPAGASADGVGPTHVLTLVAADAGGLSPRAIERVREAAGGGTPDLLAPGWAADIPLASGAPELDVVRPALAGEPIDLLITPARARRKKLLLADMDGTIVTGETLDELAALAGSGELVAAITRRSMNGELDFADALRARVATLAGAGLPLLEDTWRGVRLQPGARALVATMRREGARCALVSGGFTFFADRVARACGFDVAYANRLGDDGRVLTGTVAEPVLDPGAKLRILRELSAGLRDGETLAVGDGANDLEMLRGAGLGIAFRPKPVLQAAIANRVEHADLRALLFAQGFRAREIAEEE